MLHRLRLALKTGIMGTKLGGKESGGCEIDETFIGGKLHNMHKDPPCSLRFRAWPHWRSYWQNGTHLSPQTVPTSPGPALAAAPGECLKVTIRAGTTIDARRSHLASCS
jgi:hypothetical protein